MTRLDFHSQVMPRDGGSLANLTTEVTQDAHLPPKHVMLREALQNSCDQRVSDSKSIDFFVDSFAMTGQKFKFLKELLREGNSNSDPLGINDLLGQDSVEVLAFADKGTKGLFGPTDASLAEPGNFVDYFFVFGRGADKGTKRDGGSRGTGRITLNNASKYSTVLVYSQFKENGVVKSRLMGFANGSAFNHQRKRYTGRHWWGVFKNDRIQPIEGRKALDIATRLGMRDYLNNDTGFVAFIVGNRYVESKDESSRSAERQDQVYELREAAYFYGWPHMLELNHKKSVNFHFEFDDQYFPFEDPRKRNELELFIKCFESLKGLTHREVKKKTLTFKAQGLLEPCGELAWTTAPTSDGERDAQENESIPISSIALIRTAKFVVKYLPVQPVGDNVSTRGVFLADENQEEEFRKSEPVAHDDWIPSRLSTVGEKNPVKQAKDKILANFKSAIQIQGIQHSGSASVLLGNLFGMSLGGLALTGAKSKSGSSERGANSVATKGVAIYQTASPTILLSTDEYYETIFHFGVRVDPPISDTHKYRAVTKAVVDNGTPESEPPVGASSPEILSIVLGNEVLDLHNPFHISADDHEKPLNVTVRNSSASAITCRIESLKSNE